MNAQQLEANSNLVRGEMQDTIGELRKRLTPGQLVDEVLAYTKDGGGEFLSGLGRQATANPLPVTLIGAGLAWFLFSKGQAAQPAAPYAARPSGGYAPGRGDYYANAAGANVPGSHAASAAIDKGKHAFEGAVDGVQDGIDRASDFASQASRSIAGSMESASAAGSDAMHRMSSSVAQNATAVADTARSTFAGAQTLASNAFAFLQSEPLVLVGTGIALGAAIGAGLPSTDTEDRLMGEASENLKTQAGDVAVDQFAKIKSDGQQLYSEMAKTVKNEIEELAAARAGTDHSDIPVNGDGNQAATVHSAGS